MDLGNSLDDIGWDGFFGRGGSCYRFALELASGRSVLGELSSAEETYAGVGWYFDF